MNIALYTESYTHGIIPNTVYIPHKGSGSLASHSYISQLESIHVQTQEDYNKEYKKPMSKVDV